jgi:hypothetical protein
MFYYRIISNINSEYNLLYKSVLYILFNNAA